MKQFLRHLKIYIFRGLLSIIPLVLTIFVIRLLYVGIDKQVMRAVISGGIIGPTEIK